MLCYAMQAGSKVRTVAVWKRSASAAIFSEEDIEMHKLSVLCTIAIYLIQQPRLPCRSDPVLSHHRPSSKYQIPRCHSRREDRRSLRRQCAHQCVSGIQPFVPLFPLRSRSGARDSSHATRLGARIRNIPYSDGTVCASTD